MRIDEGVSPAQASVQLDTSKRAEKVGRVGEFPGGLEACKESLVSPGEPSFYLSIHRQSWGEREGIVVPLVLILARITKMDFQASKLCGRAPWSGWTPLQSSTKPPLGALVFPNPNQTWCLDTPTPAGTV